MYLKVAHSLNDGLLNLRRADDFVAGEEMIGHCYESFFWPSFEPVHCAARYETRKLQRPTAKLIADLYAHHSMTSAAIACSVCISEAVGNVLGYSERCGWIL